MAKHTVDVLDLALKSNVPTLFMGEPGVGKTAGIIARGKKLNRTVVTLLASIREPSDFSGLPVIQPDGTVKLVPPAWAHELGENGILFLDEISTAPPAVQAALLRVVNDRVVGEYKLGKGVSVIAAANPAEYAANGFDLAPPLANRFAHVEFKLDKDDWCNNFTDYWGDPPVIAGIDPNAWANMRSLISAFLMLRQSLIINLPKEESARSGAWPSPRTWDFASRMLAAAPSVEAGIPGMAACVGTGATLEFKNWQKELDLPDPEDVIKNWEKYKIPEKSDKLFAVMSSVCTAIRMKITPERYERGWKLLRRITQETKAVDVAAVFARNLGQAKPDNYKFPVELVDFVPILKLSGAAL